MVNKKFVCKYPQYSFCGDFHCRLSKYCSLYQRYYPKSYERGHHNPIKKTYEEKRQHEYNYRLYNTLFSDYKERHKEYCKEWNDNHKKPPAICFQRRTSIVYSQICNQDCFNCMFEDCVFEANYQKLYYKYNHDKLLEKKAQYRANNRELLNEKAKQYYQDNKEACLERNLKYRQEHKEELKAYFRRRNRMYSYKMSRRKDKSICTYPQYECCGYKNCKLYYICSQLKITNRTTDEIEKDKVTL